LRSGYQELGLELVDLGEEYYYQHKKPPMEEENIDKEEGYPIKLLLEKSIV
jgi:hypothetical protein